MVGALPEAVEVVRLALLPHLLLCGASYRPPVGELSMSFQVEISIFPGCFAIDLASQMLIRGPCCFIKLRN